MYRSIIRRALGLAILASFAAALPAAADEVVARMGRYEVKASELERLLAQGGVQLRGDAQNLQAALDRLARTEVIRKALLAEAMEKGWDKKPEVTARIQRAREQVVVSAYVSNMVQPPADFPSDADVKAVYDGNQQSFAVPAQYRVAQIFVPAADGNGAQKAADLAKQAKAAGADFAGLARRHSKHAQSAAQGGDMGWLAEQAMGPAIRPVVTRLAPGQVSDPVQTEQGWHILRVAEVRSPRIRTLEEVRPYLVNSLRARKAEENERAYVDGLTQKTPVTVNEAALSKIRGAAK